MKEILFEGKRKSNGKMVQGDLIQSKPPKGGGRCWILPKSMRPLGVLSTPTRCFKEVYSDSIKLCKLD